MIFATQASKIKTEKKKMIMMNNSKNEELSHDAF